MRHTNYRICGILSFLFLTALMLFYSCMAEKKEKKLDFWHHQEQMENILWGKMVIKGSRVLYTERIQDFVSRPVIIRR